MYFINEFTGERFTNAADCDKSEQIFLKEKEKKEKEAEKLKTERAKRAKDIEKAREEMTKAEQKYKDLVNAFVRDYDSYHYSLTKTNLNDMVDEVFRFF